LLCTAILLGLFSKWVSHSEGEASSCRFQQ
jgi:hypothetical protein